MSQPTTKTLGMHHHARAIAAAGLNTVWQGVRANHHDIGLVAERRPDLIGQMGCAANAPPEPFPRVPAQR